MKKISAALILLFSIILFPAASKAEYIFIKDGSIIKGTIVSDSSGYITIKTAAGQREKVERRKILRIQYGELNRAKLYVQKRDGGNFVAFLVDEDRDIYIFRKELNKPEEFTTPKKDVLFMAEKNPSALKGEPSSDSVKLSWLPPYGQIRKYKIYIKNKKTEPYRLAGTTGDKSITITGLDGQKEYFFIVRAVDDTGYETSPSNEIKAVTRSSLPQRPEVRVRKNSGDEWDLSWERPSDRDGVVKLYRVYIERDGDYALFLETDKLTATIPAETAFDSVQVRSVDNNGDESETVSYRDDWRFLLSPLYVVPVGKMTEISGNGFGAEFSVSRRDIPFSNFELGLSGGLINADGREKIGEGNSSVNSLIMYPVSMFIALRIPVMFDPFELYDRFSLLPRISAGAVIMQMEYDLLNNSGGIEESKKALIIEPALRFGFFAEAGISRNLFIMAGAEYIYLIDSVKGLGMLDFSISAGLRF